MAKDGKTIIITIHQPSSQVYDMFNKLCLMALGEIVYLGPAKKVINIFKQAGYPMIGRDNPAEYCIEELGLKEDEYDDDRRERVMVGFIIRNYRGTLYNLFLEDQTSL